MNWTVKLHELRENEFTHLAEALSEAAYAAGAAAPLSHPVALLLANITDHRPATTIRETELALSQVCRWLDTPVGSKHRGWYQSKLKALAKDTSNAAGALGEIRAFGTLLSTFGELTHLQVSPNPTVKNARSADFAFHDNESTRVEVCTLRTNDDELLRQEQLREVEAQLTREARAAAEEALPVDVGASKEARANGVWRSPKGEIQRHSVSAKAVRHQDGRAIVVSTGLHDIIPQGPDKGGPTHTVASRVAARKGSGQVPNGVASVLWMDCCDQTWPLTLSRTSPVEVFWKGMMLASTFGVWHAFYGEKGSTPMMERSPVGLPLGPLSSASMQQFDGRFYGDQGDCWSLAVLKCTDGLALFENPNARKPVPFVVLRGLCGLRGYAPHYSFHRYAEDGMAQLHKQVELVQDQLAFMAFADGPAPSRPTSN